jgi:hypothetical protein
MPVWAVWRSVSSHDFNPRLARHELPSSVSVDSAGAHVGTVRPIMLPFRTLIARSSGNWTVCPK